MIASTSPTAPSTKPADVNRDLEFLFEVGCLRYIQRTWRQFLNPDFENLAEHTMRVIWVAIVLAQREQALNPQTQIDTGKMIKMALVHDLSESRSVDVHYVSRQFADRHEPEALNNTLDQTSVQPEFEALWHEYEKRECIEAKLVKDADNIDVDLELREQATRGFQMEQDLKSMRQHVGATKLYTQAAKELWPHIESANPAAWHVNSVNRFNSGDWKK